MSTSSGISPKSSEIKQPSYLELDLIYGDGLAECAERSAAQRGRRARSLMPGLLVPSGVLPKPTFQSQGSGSLSPAFPLLNPPPPGRARLHLLRRSAALARLGATFAPLGRKNRVPRGLQKMIKF